MLLYIDSIDIYAVTFFGLSMGLLTAQPCRKAVDWGHIRRAFCMKQCCHDYFESMTRALEPNDLLSHWPVRVLRKVSGIMSM